MGFRKEDLRKKKSSAHVRPGTIKEHFPLWDVESILYDIRWYKGRVLTGAPVRPLTPGSPGTPAGPWRKQTLNYRFVTHAFVHVCMTRKVTFWLLSEGLSLSSKTDELTMELNLSMCFPTAGAVRPLNFFPAHLSSVINCTKLYKSRVSIL